MYRQNDDQISLISDLSLSYVHRHPGTHFDANSLCRLMCIFSGNADLIQVLSCGSSLSLVHAEKKPLHCFVIHSQKMAKIST